MKPFSYWKWPRTGDGLILLESTGQALFYASKIYKDEDRIDEVNDHLDRSKDVLEDMNPLSKDNVTNILSTSFEIQFFNECLAEVERLELLDNP